MEIKISIANDSDFLQILKIWEYGVLNNYPNTSDLKSLVKIFRENFLSRIFPYEFWIAKTDDNIVAWVSILPVFIQPLKRKTDVEISIYVAENHNNKGIGSKITRYVLEELNKSDIESVWAFVLHHNLNSIKMCKNAGLELLGCTNKKTLLIKEYMR